MLAGAVRLWQVAAAIGVLSFMLFLVARIQLARAREAWADAFFYSPSQKPKQRQRRQQWHDRSWALLILTVASFSLALVLYFLRR